MRRITLTALLSIGLISCGVGCPSSSSDFKKTSELKKAPPVHEHEHGAKGPHGGSVVELGAEEFHAEVLVDHDSHAVRVHMLGKDAKTAEAVGATDLTITPGGKPALTLKATPLKTDGDGKASVFELIDDDVVHALLDAKFIHGQLRITIVGKPYSGEVDYHLDGAPHDHKDDKDHPAPKTETPTDDAGKKDDAPQDKPADETQDKVTEPK